MYKFHTLSFFCPFIFENSLCILRAGKRKSVNCESVTFYIRSRRIRKWDL